LGHNISFKAGRRIAIHEAVQAGSRKKKKPAKGKRKSSKQLSNIHPRKLYGCISITHDQYLAIKAGRAKLEILLDTLLTEKGREEFKENAPYNRALCDAARGKLTEGIISLLGYTDKDLRKLGLKK